MSSLLKISDNIWLFPFNPEGVQANVGVIIDDDQTGLIDSGNSPQQARLIKSELEKIQAPPVKYILLTHHHWDHTFGASVFNDCEIVAHELTYDYLKQMKKINWNKEYILNEIKNDPSMKLSHEAKLAAIKDWDSFDISLPTMTFTNSMTLELKSVSLELSHIGGVHAKDSILIKELNSNVFFVGDCFYPKPSDNKVSLDILKSLHRQSAKIYIHGHGNPADITQLEAFIRQVENN
ncbi:metallo-beta-lactamase superfamily protein [Cytobacillus oceanisediminis]|uniref:Metallo-beta-lactamase superfamily protein n=1 Tax=Cytobacillus oceanisediminis TaxID=665099 RepID=A0A2V2ZQL3_9BACI|nr:MBL fold metallo-hydrolase [Cytobacillus oceanisediminis]PWW26638.1 metallo-beta-lactamase superfamily protein [Cytobacillus oceanisediminis]